MLYNKIKIEIDINNNELLETIYENWKNKRREVEGLLSNW
jgi:hypothetical protein